MDILIGTWERDDMGEKDGLGEAGRPTRARSRGGALVERLGQRRHKRQRGDEEKARCGGETTHRETREVTE
jgi:hypothetical protein